MQGLLKSFAKDRRGNFAMTAAIVAVPLVLAVGMALDYSMMVRAKAALQQATDTAALAVSREGPQIGLAQSQEIATAFLTSTGQEGVSDITVTRNEDQVTVTASVPSGVEFAKFLNWSPDKLYSSSTAEYATLSYEIGLVLDTTGSMAGGKLQAMKEAVHTLIDDMSAQVMQKSKLKIAMIPFATFVNVGPDQGPVFDAKNKQVAGSGKSWLDLNGASPIPQGELTTGASRFQVYKNLGQKWPGCVESRYAAGKDYDVDDTPPSAAKPETRFVPALAIDEPDSGFQNSYIKSNAKPYVNTIIERIKRWAKYGVNTTAMGIPLNNGMLDAIFDLLGLGKITIDTSLSNGEPKGPGRGCTMQPITALSDDMNDLKAKVDALQASGNTNITEGVAWGMRVLSPTEPFTEGSPVGKKNVRRVMVLLTDGSNTFGATPNEMNSLYTASGYMADGRLGFTTGTEAQANAAMNDRTLKACDVAKKQGIEVYTIRLEEPNVTTGTMLKDCATDPDHYFDVPNRAQLDEAFKGIKDSIVTVRLAS